MAHHFVLDAPRQELALRKAERRRFLEQQPGQIGVEQVIGKQLKDLLPAADWARDARKEALWLTFRARTRAELLERLGKTKLGSPWYYAPPGGGIGIVADRLLLNVAARGTARLLLEKIAAAMAASEAA